MLEVYQHPERYVNDPEYRRKALEVLLLLKRYADIARLYPDLKSFHAGWKAVMRHDPKLLRGHVLAIRDVSAYDDLYLEFHAFAKDYEVWSHLTNVLPKPYRFDTLKLICSNPSYCLWTPSLLDEIAKHPQFAEVWHCLTQDEIYGEEILSYYGDRLSSQLRDRVAVTSDLMLGYSNPNTFALWLASNASNPDVDWRFYLTHSLPYVRRAAYQNMPPLTEIRSLPVKVKIDIIQQVPINRFTLLDLVQDPSAKVRRALARADLTCIRDVWRNLAADSHESVIVALCRNKSLTDEIVNELYDIVTESNFSHKKLMLSFLLGEPGSRRALLHVVRPSCDMTAEAIVAELVARQPDQTNTETMNVFDFTLQCPHLTKEQKAQVLDGLWARPTYVMREMANLPSPILSSMVRLVNHLQDDS